MFKWNEEPGPEINQTSVEGDPVEKFKVTPEMKKFQARHKKLKRFGQMLKSDMLVKMRAAQVSQQNFTDFARLWDYHTKMVPDVKVNELPGQ